MKLPSLHLPVIALAGLLAGLGLWYLVTLLSVLWMLVLIGVVLLVVLESVGRLSQALFARLGGRGDEPTTRMPHMRRREWYLALGGLVAGLIWGYGLWGSVLTLGQGAGA
ncbi:hypothetical protein FGG78_17375 [Thioclava sp. BHET1]|uniref:Uncharacterized protein n=1 Tax=Thioclava dalianensis TaxID=1185766 RepID=A0A074TF49_9RHOB|nr:hypothetical protein [Thioclava dalianensis]KEP70284.1 hypothetical protein DL1_19035 [Thioclava dalianensis]TMV88242.1 hypothetical protein FGG78_17375 [Thioclava sp. BHET1]SFM82220.1 hypothetical protein SAMN05216224_101466 [Thioclava dalianensis]